MTDDQQPEPREMPTPAERRDVALVGGDAPELRAEPAGQHELAHLARRAPA